MPFGIPKPSFLRRSSSSSSSSNPSSTSSHKFTSSAATSTFQIPPPQPLVHNTSATRLTPPKQRQPQAQTQGQSKPRSNYLSQPLPLSYSLLQQQHQHQPALHIQPPKNPETAPNQTVAPLSNKPITPTLYLHPSPTTNQYLSLNLNLYPGPNHSPNPNPYPNPNPGLYLNLNLNSNPYPNPSPNFSKTPRTSTSSFGDILGTPPPPRLPSSMSTTSSIGPNGGTPSSPRARQLSDRARAAPSSLVRQLRSFSHSMTSANFNFSDPNLKALSQSPQSGKPYTISGQELLRQNKEVTSSLPPQLSPIITLINAQKLRTYAIGTFQVPAIDEFNNKVWIEVEGKLTGNELAIWRPSEEEFFIDAADEFKPRYINLTDVKIVWGANLGSTKRDYDLKISQTFDESFLIKFNDPEDLYIWSAAICLSNFEYTSLNEAFTAVMLSLKAKDLSDIHILLSKQKRFAKNEWCNIRIPQISLKWIKVYVSIIPPDGKKNNGRIEIYANEKMNKKNLILYVNKLHGVYNVYPEQPNIIDSNAIMKLDGEVFINKNYEALFDHDLQWLNIVNQPPPTRVASFAFRSHSRSTSQSSIGSNGGNRSRSASTSSVRNPFFLNAPSPKQEFSPSLPSASPNSGLSSSFFKKEAQQFAQTNCIYLMPQSHPSVPVIETMIRNFIEIIDAFKLYGRPERISSDKNDVKSMLFGLPSLPCYKYLSMTEGTQIVKKFLKVAKDESWENYDWRVVIKNFINNLQLKNGYIGEGNIIKLYRTFDNLEFDEALARSTSTTLSPKVELPQPTVLGQEEASTSFRDDLLLELYNPDSIAGIDAFSQEPSEQSSANQLGSGFNSLDNLPSTPAAVAIEGGLGEPVEFSAQLRAAAAKVRTVEHSYYSFSTSSNELGVGIANTNPLKSSPLRPI